MDDDIDGELDGVFDQMKKLEDEAKVEEYLAEKAKEAKAFESMKSARQLTKDEKVYVAQLQAAVDQGDFKIQSPLGQRFYKQHKKQGPLCIKYQEIKSHSAKAEYRKEWAKKELQVFRESKIEEQAWQEVDTSQGTYLCWARIAQEEGGDAAGRAAAFRYVRKATALGGKWTSWNPMTDRQEYLYLKRTYTETMARSWRLLKEATSGPGGVGPTTALAVTPNDPAPKPDDPVLTPRDPMLPPTPKPPKVKSALDKASVCMWGQWDKMCMTSNIITNKESKADGVITKNMFLACPGLDAW